MGLPYPQACTMSMHNAHPYFSLKNLGKKSVHYTWQNMDFVFTHSHWMAIIILAIAIFLSEILREKIS